MLCEQLFPLLNVPSNSNNRGPLLPRCFRASQGSDGADSLVQHVLEINVFCAIASPISAKRPIGYRCKAFEKTAIRLESEKQMGPPCSCATRNLVDNENSIAPSAAARTPNKVFRRRRVPDRLQNDGSEILTVSPRFFQLIEPFETERIAVPRRAFGTRRGRPGDQVLTKAFSVPTFRRRYSRARLVSAKGNRILPVCARAMRTARSWPRRLTVKRAIPPKNGVHTAIPRAPPLRGSSATNWTHFELPRRPHRPRRHPRIQERLRRCRRCSCRCTRFRPDPRRYNPSPSRNSPAKRRGKTCRDALKEAASCPE